MRLLRARPQRGSLSRDPLSRWTRPSPRRLLALPPAASLLLSFDADEFKLVRRLGSVGWRRSAGAPSTLSWRGGGDDRAPDSLAVDSPARALLLGGGAAAWPEELPGVVTLYAAVHTPTATRVMLKCHDPAAAGVALAELAAYEALLPSRAELSAARASGFGFGFGGGDAEPPVAPLLGSFTAPGAPDEDEGDGGAVSRDDDAAPRPWLVQRWTPLGSFATYPAAARRTRRQRARDGGGGGGGWLGGFWPPVVRTRDADPLSATRAALAGLCRGAASALAYCHGRGVAHGAVCGAALRTPPPPRAATAGAANAGARPPVTLADFGFARVARPAGEAAAAPGGGGGGAAGAEAAAASAMRADCRALSLALAELVLTTLCDADGGGGGDGGASGFGFGGGGDDDDDGAPEGGAGGGGGPGGAPLGSAASLDRLVGPVYGGDWAAFAEHYAGAEPRWGAAAGLLSAAGGAGWDLLQALWDAPAADDPAVGRAAEAFERAADGVGDGDDAGGG